MTKIKIINLKVSSFDTNCYIIYKDDYSKCIVIDPGGESEKINNKILSMNLSISHILCTHGHPDHTGGVNDLFTVKNIEFYIGEGDESLIDNPPKFITELLPDFKSPPTNYKIIKKDTVIKLDDIDVNVIKTPGHTPGSLSFYCEGMIFTGDTLFKGSVGRTDLGGGDFDLEISSIKDKIFSLPEDTLIYPGHGSSTKISAEKSYNPFLKNII